MSGFLDSNRLKKIEEKDKEQEILNKKIERKLLENKEEEHEPKH